MSDCTTGLYTCDELLQKLRDLNDQLDSAETRSKLDTSQSEHEFSISVRTIREQYEKYLSMLKIQCPDCYHRIKGPSIVKFGGRPC